jgi:hypothetical protein
MAQLFLLQGQKIGVDQTILVNLNVVDVDADVEEDKEQNERGHQSDTVCKIIISLSHELSSSRISLGKLFNVKNRFFYSVCFAFENSTVVHCRHVAGLSLGEHGNQKIGPVRTESI